MFDIGWSELAVIAVIALVVIGPKDLPHVLYMIGKWVRKARALARDFQSNLDDMVREAELEDLKKQAQAARDFNIQREVEKTIDPTGSLKSAFDVSPAEAGIGGHPGSPPEVVEGEEAMLPVRPHTPPSAAKPYEPPPVVPEGGAGAHGMTGTTAEPAPAEKRV